MVTQNIPLRGNRTLGKTQTLYFPTNAHKLYICRHNTDNINNDTHISTDM